MAACSVHTLIRLSRNCLCPLSVAFLSTSWPPALLYRKKTVARLASLVTEQDAFTGSCKRDAGSQKALLLHYFVGLHRALPDQGIHSPAFLSSIYTACRGAPAGPTFAFERTRPGAGKLVELLRAWPRGCAASPIDLGCQGRENRRTTPSARSSALASSKPPNTRHLNNIETVQGSSHLSCPLPCNTFSRLRLSNRPSVFLRQDPALRIPHSHSWCGAIGSPPPQGQEFQVQTDPPAWGRQRQITACA